MINVDCMQGVLYDQACQIGALNTRLLSATTVGAAHRCRNGVAMNDHYPTADEPATPEFVLAVIRDIHRQQCQYDPEAQPDMSLTFDSTVAEWQSPLPECSGSLSLM
jgi:hypothetical protein